MRQLCPTTKPKRRNSAASCLDLLLLVCSSSSIRFFIVCLRFTDDVKALLDNRLIASDAERRRSLEDSALADAEDTSLRARVRALEAENAKLRAENDALRKERDELFG